MIELFRQAILPANIPLTILLGLCLLYWITVIVGALDADSIDVDFDMDADVDLDVDVDVDTGLDVEIDVDADTGIGGISGALYFFNFGRLPFMVILTFLILSMWTLSLIFHFNFGSGLGMSLAFLPINLFCSLVVTKLVTAPLLPIFKDFGKGTEEVRYIGKQCKVLLPPTTTSMGQGEVNVDDKVLLVNIKLIEEGELMLKGDLCTILELETEKNIYLVDKI